MIHRLRPAFWWTIPILISFAVYYPGLQAWFRMDDFAWLGLKLEIHSWNDFWRVLFEPRAQGTIRTLSERAFFLAFFHWFELDALPYRIVVFATHALNLMLLSILVRRLTANRWTAFWAVTFWGVNPALSTPLSWTSVYNQVLCSTVLLGALLLFIRYCGGSRKRDYAAMLAVFVAGFGVLEMNSVFPALAAAYALFFARHRLVATLPLFAISGLYTVVHNRYAPKQHSGTYGMFWDFDMAGTLGQYLLETSGSRQIRGFYWIPWTGPAGDATSWLLIGALVIFLAWRLTRRDLVAAFAAAWFLILIGPVLPLKNHVTLYYLTMPTIGLSLLGAWALTTMWTHGRLARALAAAAAMLYLAAAMPVSHAASKMIRDRSFEVRHMVFGVERARQLHPDKIILLTNVTNDMFWWGLNDRPFRLIGVDQVFLAPGADELIDKHPGYGTPEDHVLPPSQSMRALERGEALVYSVAPERLTNVTESFQTLARARWTAGLATRVDTGHPAFADQLGPGWSPIENGFRWMQARAVVWLAGPSAAGHRLYLTGYCARAVVEKGPVHLSVSIDGRKLSTFEVSNPDSMFEYEIPLTEVPLGLPKVEIVLEVDRTLDVPGEPMGLGLVFGTITIR